MIPQRVNHFGKRTVWSLIYFWYMPIITFSPVANFGDHPLPSYLPQNWTSFMDIPNSIYSSFSAIRFLFQLQMVLVTVDINAAINVAWWGKSMEDFGVWCLVVITQIHGIIVLLRIMVISRILKYNELSNAIVSQTTTMPS